VPGLTGMVVFGAGLGLFMAPDSNAKIAAAPSQYSGTAAGMVNLMRVLGSCIGVSAASSMMAWRLEQRGGRDSVDVLFGGRALLDAIETSLAVLVVFAVTIALLSLQRPSRA
jgi:hypothetical protein